MRRGPWLLGWLVAGLALTGWAQEQSADRVARLTLQAEEEQPTLPPVIVEPERPLESAPPPAEVPFVEAPPALNADWPRLSELDLGQPGVFGQNTGVLRSRQSLFDTPAAASIVTGEQIREKEAADMFQALQYEVGVLMQRTAAGQASPFVRGLTGQQVLILIDGIRLNNSTFRFGPNQYFNTIDPGMIDHIEVLRGQGSVLWGSDAIGGAINLVSRGPDIDYALRYGGYEALQFTQYYNTSDSSPYSRLNVEGWVGRTGAFAGGSFLNVRDLDTGFDDFTRQPGTNYQQYAGDIKLNYLLDEQQLLTLSLQHLEQENLPRSDRFPGYPGDVNNSNRPADARFFDPQQRDLIYLRYQAVDMGPAIDALTFTASYHRQREIQTRGIPTTRTQETDVRTTGLNLVVAKDLDFLGHLTSGVDWYHDDIDSAFGGSARGPILPDDAYYERIGWFLNWDLQVAPRLKALAGVRFEHIDAGGTPIIEVNGVPTPVSVSPSYGDWIAQVGLSYDLNECTRLVGSVSEGFRAPNLDELMANNPNVLQEGMDFPSLGLIPERAITYEVGIKTDGDRLRSQTFVFWTDLNNNIVPISVGPNEFARANQDSYIQGVELSGQYLLEYGWSLYGNFWYTYGKNLVIDAPLSRIPPMQGVLGLAWRDPERLAYFDVFTWLVDRQDRLDPVRDTSDERIPLGGTPGFGTLNIRCGRVLGCCRQHRVSLVLENLTDQPYLVHGSGVYGTGFTARFGYQWDY